MRYITLLLLAVLSMTSVKSYGEGAPRRVILDRVVAVIGSSSILKSDVDHYANMIEEQQRTQGYTSPRDVQSQAFEMLLTQKLLYTQAQIDSVEIDPMRISAEVEQQVDYLQQAAGGLVELERQQNMEIYNIRAMLSARAEEQGYAQAMKGAAVTDLTITPGEVERYYKSHDRDSLPMVGEQYRYAQITRFPASLDEAKRRVRERLVDMRKRIINGEAQFTSLARMYSKDPASAYRGGEMEPMPAAGFVSEFADALEALKPDQVSEVVETEFGFHIIQLIDTKGNLYHCRHILLRPEFTTDELMEPINFLDSLAGQIRRDSVTFEKAAFELSDDDASKMNGGVVTNHDVLERNSGGYVDVNKTQTKFLKEDFGATGGKSLDDYVALSKLKKGEISEAFTTEDLLGNQLAKIVKLVEVYPAHVASLEEDYLRLEEFAMDAKKRKAYDEWLANTVAKTYIYIDPEYRTLDFEKDIWLK